MERNGNVMIAKKMEKLRCGVLQKSGKRSIITLDKVKFVQHWKVLRNGFKIGNDGKLLRLTKKM
jgi:hypothetical protein